MATFVELERAMKEWVRAAIPILQSGTGPEEFLDLRRWQRDEDGLFRDRERVRLVWRHSEIDRTRKSPAWQAIEQVVQANERLKAQMDTLVGTQHGASRFDVDRISRSVLPGPDEVDNVDAAFARRYSQLDKFLAAEEFECTAVWPVPGLTSDNPPISLEPGVKLDIMTDDELAAALNTGLVPLFPPDISVLSLEESKNICLRRCYKLRKQVGNASVEELLGATQSVEERNQAVAEIFEQTFALLFSNPVALSGRMSLDSKGAPGSMGVAWYTVPLTHAQRNRRLHLDEDTVTELVDTWRALCTPSLLQRQKGLGLALRRLSYQAGRTRIEDELVDILIAGEALYLSDVGFQELGFRMALRAAALCDPGRLNMTRRQVFDLMKSAYNVRSKIVHGDVPKTRDLKVRNTAVPLHKFVQAVEDVIRDGVREALRRSIDPAGTWPPDWDELTLPNP